MPEHTLNGQCDSVPEVVRDASLVVQRAFVATRVNQASVMHRQVVERAVDAVLQVVVESLERGYHPQNPTNAHPADWITKRFLMPGHEGLEV